MTVVSRNRPATRDRQGKASQPGDKDVNLARITYYGDTHVACSCGWSFGHIREKVREDAIDRHLVKRHGGVGMRW